VGRGVVLVRHALPEVTPGVAPANWPLLESSREDCVLLAHHLPEKLAPVVLTSPERKADETARVIALRRSLQWRVDPRLREVERPDEWSDNYRERAEAYLADGGCDGWEPHAKVVARVGAAVDEALREFPEGDLVVAGHGLALTLFAASRWGFAPAPFWRKLTFPDAWRFDLETGEKKRLYLVGQPQSDA